MPLQENIDEIASKQWFLVRCKSKQESRAHLNFTNQCIVSYYPTVEVAKISKGKRVVKNEALFPGYIFVYLDPSSYLASKVKNTLCVILGIGFVCECFCMILRGRFVEVGDGFHFILIRIHIYFDEK